MRRRPFRSRLGRVTAAPSVALTAASEASEQTPPPRPLPWCFDEVGANARYTREHGAPAKLASSGTVLG
jgi:hypothetical protein